MPPLDSLPIEFLFRIQVRASEPIRVSPGPQGDRLIVGVLDGTFEGPKLSGKVLPGSGSEWATTRPDLTLKADVRLVLETGDGAHILMTYNGIGTLEDGALRVRTAPLFQTGDERYGWLNVVQAVGLGTPTEDGIAYDVYRVL
jgi:hypothetical protein